MLKLRLILLVCCVLLGQGGVLWHGLSDAHGSHEHSHCQLCLSADSLDHGLARFAIVPALQQWRYADRLPALTLHRVANIRANYHSRAPPLS